MNAISIHPIPILVTIIPNCLKVDKATIFFISVSPNAETLAIIIVISPLTSTIS